VWTALTEEITQGILKDAGFALLDNESREFAPGLFIAGTRSYTKTHYTVSRPDPQRALAQAGSFTMLLSHEPDQFLENAKYPFTLQLSGHSHGGQVALPLIGPLLLPEGGKKFPYGEYKLGERALITSRGLGTSILKVRFLAPPEIVVVTLRCE
jgi:predicted MPP superfamily phosphohydrolase